MIIALIGPSGSGKSVIAKELASNHNCKNVVSYTTRLPRLGEIPDEDYHFVSQMKFEKMKRDNEFVEYEEYTNNRFYGTSRDSVKEAANSNDIYIMVLTPNGYRKIQKEVKDGIKLCYINAPLGVRVKRYIDRCDDTKFNFDDMNEINSRVNRDYGMFLGIEKEADFIITNKEYSKDKTEQLNNIKKITNDFYELFSQTLGFDNMEKEIL